MKSIIQKMGMFIAMFCTSLSLFAYDFEVDGFYYQVNLEKMTATVVSGENKQVGDIVIPEKVTYKGRDFDVTAIEGAFTGNTDLTGVTIPQGVTSLGNNAFEGCTSLKSISGLENVSDIKSSCFKGCTALVAITLPQQLKTIDDEAFRGCLSLTQVEIPQNVISIGSEAFRDCKNLISVTLPNSLTNLSSGLFYACESLSQFDIPASTKSIYDEVFYGCQSLTNICIPSSVESIGNAAFYGCSNLTGIVFEQSSTAIKVGYNREYTQSNDTYKTPLFEDCNVAKVEIGRNIYSNSGYWRTSWGCFAKTGIQTVILSKNVTSLQEGAFYECVNLSEISIPNSITSIGEWAFYGSGLKRISFEDGYDNLKFSLCVRDWSDKAPHTFNNCKIEDVYIGRTILISGGSQNPGYGGNPSTFFPTSLSTIIIGDYVKNIDAVLMNEQKITSSLSHYPNLETVQFGTNLTKLPSLIDNSMLTHLSTSSVTPPSANPFSNSQYMDLTVEIPEGSLDAYKSAPVWMNFWEFKERANLLHCIEFDEILYRILIDNEVEAIKKDSEYGGNIIIPSNFEYNNKTYNVISIGEAFKGCSTLSTISLPSSVGTLGSNCFADCIKLERVEIKGNLKEIPYGAFRNCTKLTHIQVPETVTRISGYAFSGCSALNEFTCYKAIESIEESAFEGCSSIASFSTNNVSSLGQSAFKNCVGLKHVELNNKIRVISSECFSGCANLETISNLQSITKIENNAFENCKLITDFVLPQIISISDYAFENCENASSFILGDDLEQLGNGVFYNCRSVESIIIPGNVNSIGSSVFSGCSALKDLSFNEGDAILELPVGYYDRETSVLKKEVNGKTIQFKIKYYKSVFDGLNIEKLFLGRNLSNAPRYTISGDGGVNYYLITSYDSPFNNLPMLKELQIGDNVNVLGPDEIYIPEVEMYETPGAFKNCNSLVKVSVKNTTPPSGVEFSNSTYSKATLIVPDNTVSLYKVANGWKEFLNILDESSTSIDGVSCNELSGNLSIGRNGLLYMGGSPEHILIYRIDGTLYYSGYIEPNQSISLDSGLYIIRLKENSIKIQI